MVFVTARGERFYEAFGECWEAFVDEMEMERDGDEDELELECGRRMGLRSGLRLGL